MLRRNSKNWEQVDQQKDKLEEAIKETSKKTEEKIRELLLVKNETQEIFDINSDIMLSF